MDDNAEKTTSVVLPPKLDLRKQNILKDKPSGTAPVAAVSKPAAPSAAVTGPKPGAAKPSVPGAAPAFAKPAGPASKPAAASAPAGPGTGKAPAIQFKPPAGAEKKTAPAPALMAKKPGGPTLSADIAKLGGPTPAAAVPKPAAPAAAVTGPKPAAVKPAGPAAAVTGPKPAAVKPADPAAAVTGPKPAAKPAGADPGQPLLSLKKPITVGAPKVKPVIKPVSASPKAETEIGEVSKLPETVRLKPAQPAPGGIRISKPVLPSQPPSVAAASPGGASKSKTSRISLDASAASEAEGAQEPGQDAPKTIKLKRPGETAAKTAPRPVPAKAEKKEKTKDAASDQGQISGSDGLPVEDEDSSSAKRKTIRIKRSVEQPSVSSASVEQTPSDPELFGNDKAALVAAGGVEDEPGPLFTIIAIAAVLVVCVVIYMLAAQSLGPDLSLTELSYYKNGPSLGWPGKIPPSL